MSPNCPSFRTFAPSGLSLRRFFLSGDCGNAGGMTYSDPLLRDVLTRTRRIAVVGVSMNPVRPSYFVARYLSAERVSRWSRSIPAMRARRCSDRPVDAALVGYRGRCGYGRHLSPVRGRAGDRGGGAGSVSRRLQTIWMQIGVSMPRRRRRPRARGVTVIQNRCPKIEYQRLFGELRMGGFATGIISSKL